MRYVGLDIHKKAVVAAIVDEDGNVVKRGEFACDRTALTRFAEEVLDKDDHVAVEATTNCWAVADILQPYVAEHVVSNPLKTRAIATAKVKTDKVDALVLAQLLRCGYLPGVWVPDPETRLLRHLTSRHASLVAERTRIKNRIHAVLHQRLLRSPFELFSKAGRRWLEELKIDEAGRQAIDSELRLLECVEGEIARLGDVLAQRAHADERARLLMTLPGVDYTVALFLLAALGNLSRFPDGDHAASYLGLVPSTRQSGEHCYHGPITKRGRSHARWMMVQAAQHVARHPGPLGVFFRRLAHRKNHNVAVVATARKLVVIAYEILKHNEPYRYAAPRTTEAKLARLRVKATGSRRRGGLPKGSRRPANYGKGGTRAVPSLEGVCAKESLPAPQALRPGEQRTVERTGTKAYVESIHRERRKPRASARRQ